MTIGYVHVGPPEHGVSRYGRLLAAAARVRSDLRVFECELRLSGEVNVNRDRVAEAARCLSGSDLIHVQYNNQLTGSVWGPGWHQLRHLKLFTTAARAPIVATVHDIYLRPRQGWRWIAQHPIQQLQTTMDIAPQVITLRWLHSRASCLFVCTEEERSRLVSHGSRVRVIPHFVERRVAVYSKSDAKATLGLNGKKVITVLGYIHPRKGHRLVVEALGHLPSNVVAIFAGGPTRADSPFVPELLRLAQVHGVAERVRITDYLPEEELDKYMAATDLAVCPFKTLSASSSLSTWISAVRPILASTLPQIAEYNMLEAGAIRTFGPYTADALATAIRTALDAPSDDLALARLRDRLTVQSMLDLHVETYRALLRGNLALPVDQRITVVQ